MDWNSVTIFSHVCPTCIYPLDITSTCVKALVTWPNKYINYRMYQITP